jgi:hypothetical protein
MKAVAPARQIQLIAAHRLQHLSRALTRTASHAGTKDRGK